jgi:hypothetical protein
MGLSAEELKKYSLRDPGAGREWIIEKKDGKTEAILFDTKSYTAKSRIDVTDRVQPTRSGTLSSEPKLESRRDKTVARPSSLPAAKAKAGRGAEVKQTPIDRVDPRSRGGKPAGSSSKRGGEVKQDSVGKTNPRNRSGKPVMPAASVSIPKATEAAISAAPAGTQADLPFLSGAKFKSTDGNIIQRGRLNDAAQKAGLNPSPKRGLEMRSAKDEEDLGGEGLSEEAAISKLLKDLKTLFRLGGSGSESELLQLWEELQAVADQTESSPRVASAGPRKVERTVETVGGMRIPAKYAQAILSEYGADFRRIQDEQIVRGSRGGSRQRGVAR